MLSNLQATPSLEPRYALMRLTHNGLFVCVASIIVSKDGVG